MVGSGKIAKATGRRYEDMDLVDLRARARALRVPDCERLGRQGLIQALQNHKIRIETAAQRRARKAAAAEAEREAFKQAPPEIVDDPPTKGPPAGKQTPLFVTKVAGRMAAQDIEDWYSDGAYTDAMDRKHIGRYLLIPSAAKTVGLKPLSEPQRSIIALLLHGCHSKYPGAWKALGNVGMVRSIAANTGLRETTPAMPG